MESPDKPEPCPCETAAKSSRRDFLLKAGIGLNVVAGGLVSVPILGYALNSFAAKPDREWIDLGPIDTYPEGKTRLAVYDNPLRVSWDGATAEIPCWVRRMQGEEFTIFAIHCTHLGCPVRWFEESRLFMCPCHGGAFYEDGSHASGPPPRGLYTYEYKVENGHLMIKGGVLPTLANPNP
ncbi:MAG: hypothetical protein Fur0032_07160 [Terrimicrobiaceae bacterium]